MKLTVHGTLDGRRVHVVCDEDASLTILDESTGETLWQHVSSEFDICFADGRLLLAPDVQVDVGPQWRSIAAEIPDTVRAASAQTAERARAAADSIGFIERQLGSPLGAEGERYQYAIVNIGMFSTGARMSEVLAIAGSAGWKLIHVYDKGSNWWIGMEKGFMLLRRRVPEGHKPNGPWCITLRN